MPLSLSNRVRRRAAGAALLGALSLIASAWPAAASAKDGDVVATTPSGQQVLETRDTQETCSSPQLVQAFSGFGDARDYVLAPGGSFEGKGLDGWQVERAKVDADGSPLEVDRERNRHSLKVPAGGSATSPAMCVDLHYPTFRLMTRAAKEGELRVEVIYPDSEDPVFHPVGTLAVGRNGGWQASADMPVFPERGGAAPGMRRVALRFTSVAVNGDAGDWKIDDLYVDPRRL
jgi:hypothetical protein